jgi:adenylate cyclase
LNAPPVLQRRLAAIFCADVAGYTRLMQADEPGTMRLLAAHRAITDRLIPQQGGRIANTAGDSILAEFPSAVAAVQCALGIQERIAMVQADIPGARRVMFRIGVHVGEVVVREGDIFGDGVNIAARLQSLAEPGTVCLSGAAYDFVRGTLPLTVEDLGPQSVKNVEAPIRAVLARPSAELGLPAIAPAHRRMDFYLARRFHSTLVAALERVISPMGLTPVEPPVLNTINDAPGIEESKLAERLGMSGRKVRAAVRRLEQLGYLTVAKERGRRLTLTPAGITFHLTLQPAILAAADGVMATLSEPEREQLRDLLGRIIKANEASRDLAPAPGESSSG